MFYIMLNSKDNLEYVKKVGEKVINSEEFQKACRQKHHNNGNVGAHMIDTAYYSYMLCQKLNHIGIHTQTEELILACLCHDLGIVDNRHVKYQTGLECIHQHPLDSIPIAEELLGELSPCLEDTIRTHMWPLAVNAPRYREGVILSIIDKYCCVLETAGILKPAAALE